MPLKTFLIIFASVFLAELGDKTQLATVLFASDKASNKWFVFLAAASALVLTSAIGVLAGESIARYVDGKRLAQAAGLGFIAIGIWTLIKGG